MRKPLQHPPQKPLQKTLQGMQTQGGPLRQGALVRWLQWPNWVSLDAPVVAVSWAWLLAAVYRQPRPQVVRFAAEWWPSLAALFGAVWLIYLADRLLDCRRLNFDQDVPARHRFAHRWAMPLWGIWGTALVATGLVTLAFLDHRLWIGGAALLGGVLLYGWAVHGSVRLRRGIPKELIVAVVFAIGVGLPTLAVLRNRSLFFALISIALLFAMNCLLVSRSQIHSDRQQQIGSVVLQVPWLASRLPWLACAVAILVSGLWAGGTVPEPLGLALMASGFGLAALSFCEWSMGALLADYVLLSPLLVLALLP